MMARALVLLVASCARVSSWSVADLSTALQSFLDEAAGGYSASLAVVGVDGWEVAVATKASPESRFLFGSGTKPFIATRVMQLVDAGAVSLDEAAATWIDPALSKLSKGATLAGLFGAPAAEVTVGQLLGMKSGVADFDVEAFDAKILQEGAAVHPPDEFVRYAASVKEPYESHFVCAPGTCINYSSTNYQLLGLVLLGVAARAQPGLAWASLDVKAPLFGDEKDTRFAGLDFLDTGAMAAQGLDVKGSSGDANATIYGQDASILGWTCGNAVAPALDVARFFHDLLVAGKFVSAAALEAMTTFAPIDNGWGREAIQYGLGLMIQQTNPRGPYPPKLADDGAYVGHGGDTYGFLSEQGFYPTVNATIAVVANEDQHGDFVKNTLACGAYKIIAEVTQGRKAAVTCAP